ncbi:MAG: pyruvate, phosphate dikinase [Chloroherpetonaceae bacterium]|nr:pyruvate, phosphate dikinase [Chthonomonadaceae bacterium]MDW8209063.1 pyruvate, phosphate dikinase [Chloroherpetonaceae bacterium]
MAKKRVYLFHEGDKSMRDLLGGKGANLAEMTNIGLPVPPGFTITTEVCNEYYAAGQKLPEGLMDEVRAALTHVENAIGKKFGDPSNPLLVSVRSGAKFSMPGMMDTVLNLGLNHDTVEGLIRISNNPRFVYDSYRRFIMMLSDVAYSGQYDLLSKHDFEHIFRDFKASLGVTGDLEVDADGMKKLCEIYLDHFKKQTGKEFPQDVFVQLEDAITAVFRSWNNERAIVYRRREKISDDIGTAVNVQSMVFGNMGDDCGTGVAFTRNPATGEKHIFGEYLMNAQGEDVVAGVRTPIPINELAARNPEIYKEFDQVCRTLENHYKDVQDIEFTIEHNKLYILQCRAGKRTGQAAVKIAVDMVNEGLITKEEAVARVDPNLLTQCLLPVIAPGAKYRVLAKGLPAGPGAATGIAVFTATRAAELGKGGAGQKVILVRADTSPDDLKGMLAAQGVLTERGGMTSHAALVARGFGIPTVAGCSEIQVGPDHFVVRATGQIIREGDYISLNGTLGEVIEGEVPVQEASLSGEFGEFLSWADTFRGAFGVRANADTPKDTRIAIELGAEGIGLCRTEHMFFEGERRPVVQRMILAQTPEERQAALDELLVFQREDFKGIFEALEGRPATIRLIDPPLHEFLPKREELIAEVATLKAQGGSDPEKEALLRAVESMHEINPMMGLRGCRLSIVFPEIVEMQTRAIMEGASAVVKAGGKATPEIMIPLVGHVNELRVLRERLEATARKVEEEQGVKIDYSFGTMIEVPRGALTADEIATEAAFFSFGTNDLTQMTFGFSRDDSDKFLKPYIEQKILPGDPFESIDQAGVGQLMQIAVEKAKKVRPDIKLGICGEHGGEPRSIEFCYRIGLNYVSCSPFRVPIARLAAAQAALGKGVSDK